MDVKLWAEKQDQPTYGDFEHCIAYINLTIRSAKHGGLQTMLEDLTKIKNTQNLDHPIFLHTMINSVKKDAMV